MDALYCHPMEFSTSPLLPWIMLAILSSLGSELENPLLAVLHFLRDLLGYTVGRVPSAMPSEVPPEMQSKLRELVVNNGAILCTVLMSGMVFTFPPDCVLDGAGAMMTLIEVDATASVSWIAQSLDALPQEHLSSEERHRFLAQIQAYGSLGSHGLTVRSASHKDYRRIQRHIQDFTAIYRRRVIAPRHKGGRRGVFEGVVFHIPR
jgi:transportin-3